MKTENQPTKKKNPPKPQNPQQKIPKIFVLLLL